MIIERIDRSNASWKRSDDTLGIQNSYLSEIADELDDVTESLRKLSIADALVIIY